MRKSRIVLLAVTIVSTVLVSAFGVLLVRALPPDFGISTAPSSLTIPAGTCATKAITITSLNGFSGNVTLTSTTSPSSPGVTETIHPSSVPVPPNGAASVLKIVCAAASAPPECQVETITATGFTTSGLAIQHSVTEQDCVPSPPPPPPQQFFTYTAKWICSAPSSASSAIQFLTAWGSSGGGNGQFAQPESVAVDSSGNVYVADTLNSRIQKFTSTGAFITAWGSPGVGPGQFSMPLGVAVDSSGNVYVVDHDNNRVEKFTSTGTFITTWGSLGGLNGQFNEPFGIAVDSSGNVYVTDLNNNRIQKFTSNGVFITTWGSGGSGPGQFLNPFGVAVDSSGNNYVSDFGNRRIEKFTSNGVFITTWGSGGSGPGQFLNPVGVAVDSSGNVYVADTANDRIQKFTSTGGFITTWGSNGSGNGQFNGSIGVAVDSSGNVYVVEDVNDRVQKFAVADPLNAERIGLVPGEYMTDINVHNPSHSQTPVLREKFVESVTAFSFFGSNLNVTLTELDLKPDSSFFIKCSDILTVLGIPVNAPAEGFLIMTTSLSGLDVVVEYSQQTATGGSLDVVSIPAQASVP